MALQGRDISLPLEIQVLRQVITPRSAITSGERVFPLTLGAAADDIMLRKGVTLCNFITIVQARVHANTQEEFIVDVLDALGTSWTVRECRDLWEVIVLPGA